MNGTGECAEGRPLLGVYLTGAIEPDDRSVLVRHLAWCDRCRDELAGLAGLPALLDRPPVRAAAAADGETIAARGLPRGSHRRPRGSLTRRRRWLVAVSAAALAGAALAGWVLRPGPPVTVLDAESVGGVPVLTNGAGYTLYWFGSDTATKSNCTGSCVAYWPPVTGPATAGTGVTGILGAIKRADGSVQATYNGHPLYTASVDTAPGLAKGNDVRTDGGVWHEVTASGPAVSPAPAPAPGQEKIADVRVGDADDTEAAPGLPVHRTLALQDHQGLADRRGADPQVRRQALSAQELPRRELAHHDAFPHVGGDPVAELRRT